MFGAFLDAAMSIPNNMQMEEDRNQRQQDNWGIHFNTQAYNTSEAEKAREFNSAQAAVQRAYVTEMSNTQYQRAANDAGQAGLNRILAMRQGGAGTPSSSAAAAGAASSGGSGGQGGNPGSVHANFAAAQVMEEQKDNIAMDTRKKDAERSLASQHWNESQERTNLLNEQVHTQRESTRRERAQADSATADAKGRSLEGNIDDTTYGNIMRYIDRAVRGVTGAGSAYGRFSNQ